MGLGGFEAWGGLGLGLEGFLGDLGFTAIPKPYEIVGHD